MEAFARIKFLRIAPRKVRLLADLIRGEDVGDALNILEFSRKRATTPLKKLLDSAVANAKEQGNVDVDSLFVKSITVDKGPTLRRFKPRAMGRATRINKMTSHVEIVVSDEPF